MQKEMIQVRALSPEDCNEFFLAPFLSVLGRISEHQDPKLAGILSDDAALLVYEFLQGEKRIGYVVVKQRHRILADVQFGPVVIDPSLFVACIRILKKVLRGRGMLLLRVLPPFGMPDYPGLPGHFNWATSVVDLDRSETEILQSFSPNHRQSIKKAQQAGILVRPIREDELQRYAEGHVQMFTRRGISRNVPDTLRLVRGLYELSAGDHPSTFILTAHLQDSAMLGGAIFLQSGDTCTYYHGFAERGEPPLPVLHSLIWEAMKVARERGCARFDLCGYSLDDNDRQLKAVNDFKRWFRGAILKNPPTVVVPLYPLIGPILRLMGKRI